MSTGTSTCIPWTRPSPRTPSPSSAASHRTGRSTARACQDLDSARAGLRRSGPALGPGASPAAALRALGIDADEIRQRLKASFGTGALHAAERRVRRRPGSSAVEAHQVAVRAEHSLLHALPRLSAALVHAGPQPRSGTDDYALLASHR